MTEPRILEQWHPHWDDRNENFLAREKLLEPRQAVGLIRSYTWRAPTLDQGQTPHCTAFTLVEEAAANPVMVFGSMFRNPPDVPTLNGVAHEVYREIQAIDRAEGRYFDAGATALATAKAGVARGWFEAYYWATSAEEIASIIGRFGPVPFGSWVYDGMFTGRPGEYPVYKLTGSRRGGHEYLLNKVDAKRGLLGTVNSWGGYGAGWLEFESVDRLLREQGDAFIVQQRALG